MDCTFTVYANDTNIFVLTSNRKMAIKKVIYCIRFTFETSNTGFSYIIRPKIGRHYNIQLHIIT